ncbi:hypothetical protein GQ42DRAFT_160983 [Ramicandelaber brevisporus]|nr:hypothetical protein GQ42DRAFT_160983 [Ramicandelaber brevisporus]
MKRKRDSGEADKPTPETQRRGAVIDEAIAGSVAAADQFEERLLTIGSGSLPLSDPARLSWCKTKLKTLESISVPKSLINDAKDTHSLLLHQRAETSKRAERVWSAPSSSHNPADASSKPARKSSSKHQLLSLQPINVNRCTCPEVAMRSMEGISSMKNGQGARQPCQYNYMHSLWMRREFRKSKRITLMRNEEDGSIWLVPGFVELLRDIYSDKPTWGTDRTPYPQSVFDDLKRYYEFVVYIKPMKNVRHWHHEECVFMRVDNVKVDLDSQKTLDLQPVLNSRFANNVMRPWGQHIRSEYLSQISRPVNSLYPPQSTATAAAATTTTAPTTPIPTITATTTTSADRFKETFQLMAEIETSALTANSDMPANPRFTVETSDYAIPYTATGARHPAINMSKGNSIGERAQIIQLGSDDAMCVEVQTGILYPKWLFSAFQKEISVCRGGILNFNHLKGCSYRSALIQYIVAHKPSNNVLSMKHTDLLIPVNATIIAADKQEIVVEWIEEIESYNNTEGNTPIRYSVWSDMNVRHFAPTVGDLLSADIIIYAFFNSIQPPVQEFSLDLMESYKHNLLRKLSNNEIDYKDLEHIAQIDDTVTKWIEGTSLDSILLAKSKWSALLQTLKAKQQSRSHFEEQQQQRLNQTDGANVILSKKILDLWMVNFHRAIIDVSGHSGSIAIKRLDINVNSMWLVDGLPEQTPFSIRTLSYFGIESFARRVYGTDEPSEVQLEHLYTRCAVSF